MFFEDNFSHLKRSTCNTAEGKHKGNGWVRLRPLAMPAEKG